MTLNRLFFLAGCLLMGGMLQAQIADKQTYLSDFKKELTLKWPENRTLNIVFHGHSVPTGYACTPVVNTLQAYPHLVFHALKAQYPYAVLNVITTSIGGEQAEQGEKRFKDDVLTHRPDVLCIDYALNDRTIGLERSEKAWRKMIESALAENLKVILFTPTPDLTESIMDEKSPLSEHAEMIRQLAEEYHIGLVDSYQLFKEKAENGEELQKYMSQNNHPNSAGHSCVAAEVLTWFF